jgi:hypothetical protein
MAERMATDGDAAVDDHVHADWTGEWLQFADRLLDYLALLLQILFDLKGK